MIPCGGGGVECTPRSIAKYKPILSFQITLWSATSRMIGVPTVWWKTYLASGVEYPAKLVVATQVHWQTTRMAKVTENRSPVRNQLTASTKLFLPCHCSCVLSQISCSTFSMLLCITAGRFLLPFLCCCVLSQMRSFYHFIVCVSHTDIMLLRPHNCILLLPLHCW